MAAGRRPTDVDHGALEAACVVQHATGSHNLQVGGDLHLTVPRRAPPPVYLIAVIRKLEEVLPLPISGNRPLMSFDVESKLNFNGVVRYRRFIQEASMDFFAVDGAYNALATATYPTGKIFIQRYLRSQYRNLKAQDVNRSSDEILDLLLAEFRAMANGAEGVPPELISDCCDIIVAHAFVECTVLESPANAR